VAVAEEESARINKMGAGRELAGENGWMDEFIDQNKLAVSVQYSVDYENARVPYAEGTLTQYFYLVRESQDAGRLI
jgi:hypothetical protein